MTQLPLKFALRFSLFPEYTLALTQCISHQNNKTRRICSEHVANWTIKLLVLSSSCNLYLWLILLIFLLQRFSIKFCGFFSLLILSDRCLDRFIFSVTERRQAHLQKNFGKKVSQKKLFMFASINWYDFIGCYALLVPA